MPNNKIYLRNLDKNVTETLLKAHFSDYGEISEVILPRDKKSKALKGYAFVTFVEQRAAKMALQQDGSSLLEAEMMVQIATEKSHKKSTS